jgi:hypothetical protein
VILFLDIKKLYRNSKVNQIKDIENIINSSSEGNESIQYKNGLGWKWYNFLKKRLKLYLI